MKHITAISLSGLILLTSVGFAIDMHYCQGNLKSFSFIGKAKSCHTVAKAKITCPHHEKMLAEPMGCDLDKKDCCSNKTLHFQLDQVQKGSDTDYVFQHQLPQSVLPAAICSWPTPDLKDGRPAFVFYRPPLITRDQIILKQSFLL